MGSPFRLASSAGNLKASAIREILKVTQRPDIISFAGGLPDARLFPLDALEAAYREVFAERDPQAFQYAVTEGSPPLREFLADYLEQTQGFSVSPEQLLITNGSQQGIYLLAKLFVDPGDYVVVGRPTYMAAVKVFEDFQARFLCVDVDEDGECIDQLETLVKEYQPRFFYTIPNFQNPMGVSMSLARRKELLALSQEYNLPIVEDNPYGELYYDDSPIPSLKALDTTDQVIYLGSFSKISVPGLRLGWLCGRSDVITPLVYARQSIDLHTNGFAQRAMTALARSGVFSEHVPRVRAVYKSRMDAMLSAMREHFPPGVIWTEPAGGMFVWVTLPEGVDAQALLTRAVDEAKVAFVPGFPFYACRPEHNTLRFSFVTVDEGQIAEGIKRLGSVLRQDIEDVCG